MALGTGYDAQGCFLARALEVVGERWTLLILRDCFYGVRRFGDLLAHLDISRGVLTERLDGLVDAGVLDRHPDGRTVEYTLTAAGLELWPVIRQLMTWGERHVPADHRPRRFTHSTCGNDVDAEGRCAACSIVPDVRDLIVRPGAAQHPHLRTDPVALALQEPHRMLTPIP